ncbi:unnamed protein product [Sympodiomycopsis kandeliae]
MKAVQTFLFAASAAAAVVSSVSGSVIKERQDQLTGYAAITFKDADASIYLSLSNGNNATSYRQVNNNQPILKSTVGTKGARDPSVVTDGQGKFYLMATDLNIASTNWGAAVTTGSRSLIIWESTDLINWSAERLVEVEDETAGMVWAPSAVYQNGEFHVFWSARFFQANDPQHTGQATDYVIRHATTTDFKTFSNPTDYAGIKGTNLIDQDFLQIEGDNWIRVLKNETLNPGRVFQEKSSTGLFGTWTRVGDYTTDETSSAEGAALFKDNLDPNVFHMAQDKYDTAFGYVLYSKKGDVNDPNVLWTRAQSEFPTVNKHGQFLQLDQGRFDALNAKYPS